MRFTSMEKPPLRPLLFTRGRFGFALAPRLGDGVIKLFLQQLFGVQEIAERHLQLTRVRTLRLVAVDPAL